MEAIFKAMYFPIPFAVIKIGGIIPFKEENSNFGNWHRDRMFKTYYIFGFRVAVIEC